MKTSKKFVRAVFAAALGLLVSCASQSGSDARCVLFNATGETLISIFLSPAATTLWREQPLDFPVADGSSCVVGVANSPVVYWDIYAFAESGNVYAVYEVKISLSEPVVIAVENLMNDSSMAAGDTE